MNAALEGGEYLHIHTYIYTYCLNIYRIVLCVCLIIVVSVRGNNGRGDLLVRYFECLEGDTSYSLKGVLE